MRLYPRALALAAALAAGVAPLAIAPVAHAQEQTQLTGAQRADLRRLRNVVIEVENRAGRLQAHIAEWRGLGTQVGDNRVNNFNNDAQALADAFTLGSELAANLPAANEDVADLVVRLNAGLATYQSSITTATELLAGANDAMEAAGGREAIERNIQRADDISAEYLNFGGIMQGTPKRAYELIQQFGAIVEELQRIETQYADFLAQENADTAPLRNQIDQARNRLRRAQAEAHEAVAGARNTAESHLDNARDALATALDNRDPAPFSANGSVTFDLDTAKHYLQLARAIHAADAQPLVDRYLALDAQAKEAGQTLEAEILAANRPPADAYQGNDADTLKAGARDAWLEAHPDDTIVRVVLPVADWQRETKWTWWRDAWYFTDASRLQAGVLIQAQSPAGDPEVHYYPVNITQDHEEENQLSYSPWVKEAPEDLYLYHRILPENMGE